MPLIRIKSGKIELEIQAETVAEIKELLEIVKDYIEKASPIELQREAEEEIPHVTASTCREAIIKLLSSEWGRRPRTLREIMKAMEVNAIYYPEKTVTGILTKMVKKGLLRRREGARGYEYWLPPGAEVS
ncbi:hypothetical protein DRO02_05195 [archaeon]|nr:MAG: hypothetical protein DRO02_05195 [archaeon]RLG65951.1 MAG: hypothetical protein DRO21_00735 [archaeon]HDM24235.1 hypothetical protein [Candidatus Bathyarchaeota archaeon]